MKGKNMDRVSSIIFQKEELKKDARFCCTLFLLSVVLFVPFKDAKFVAAA
jgi:hypothetical protein